MPEENDASVARAARLREIIREQVKPPGERGQSGGEAKAPASTPRNPRDAIAERMRELDRKE